MSTKKSTASKVVSGTQSIVDMSLSTKKVAKTTKVKEISLASEMISRMKDRKSPINLRLLEKSRKKALVDSVKNFLNDVIEKSGDSYINYSDRNDKLFKEMCYQVKDALGLPQNYIIKDSIIRANVISALTFGGISNGKKNIEDRLMNGGWKKSVSAFINSLAWNVVKTIKMGA